MRAGQAVREGVVGTDAPLTAAQRRTFDILLDMIIPASADGRMPSGAEVDVLGYVRAHEAASLPALRRELDALDDRARERWGQAFAALPAGDQRAMVDSARAADPRFLRGLALHAVTSYYQHDRVLEALGMEARPPFPKGYEVPPGDLSLLDPVRERGAIYRDAPSSSKR